jgi:hypothetical protein
MSVWVGFIPCADVGGGRDPTQWVGCPGRRVHWSRVLVLDRNVTSGRAHRVLGTRMRCGCAGVVWGSIVVVAWG